MNKEQLQQMMERLEQDQRKVSLSIMATPSGGIRNELTEVNIHLLTTLSSIDKLKKLVKD